MQTNQSQKENYKNTSSASSKMESSFQEIYDAILRTSDLTRGELKFLRHVIQRKLRDGTLYLEKGDLIFRPYRHLFYM